MKIVYFISICIFTIYAAGLVSFAAIIGLIDINENILGTPAIMANYLIITSTFFIFISLLIIVVIFMAVFIKIYKFYSKKAEA